MVAGKESNLKVFRVAYEGYWVYDRLMTQTNVRDFDLEKMIAYER